MECATAVDAMHQEFLDCVQNQLDFNANLLHMLRMPDYLFEIAEWEGLQWNIFCVKTESSYV